MCLLTDIGPRKCGARGAGGGCFPATSPLVVFSENASDETNEHPQQELNHRFPLPPAQHDTRHRSRNFRN